MNSAQEILALMRFGTKTIEDCEKVFKITGLDEYETSKILEEWGKKEYSPYHIIYNVRMLNTLDEVSDYYKKFCDALIEVKKEVHKREMAKLEAENKEKVNEEKKQNEDLDKLNEQIKKDTDNLKKLSDEMKDKKDERKDNDQPKGPSPKEGPNPNLPKEESFDDRVKKEYIEETERELKKKGISDSQLNNSLGVSDWRAEMNKSSGWRTAQTFSFSINDAIKKMSNQIVCDMCKETASPIIDYIVFDKKEGKKKKFCSWGCQNAWKDKNKGIDKDEAKEIKQELQEIKDYLKNHNESVNKVLNDLFTWMKSGGIVNVTLSNDKLVVEFSGKRMKTMEESELNSEQKVLKNFLQSTSSKKSINRNELEKMVSGNYDEEGGKNKQPNSGNTGIIVAIVAVGLVLAIVVGVVIYKSRKRDY